MNPQTSGEQAGVGRKPIIPREKAHTGGKKGVRKPTRLLKDLRHVYEKPAADTDTPGQRVLRKLLADNPEKFIDRLHRAEQGHKSGSGKQAAGAGADAEKAERPGAVDEGSDRAEELYERLLAEFAAREGKR